MMKQYKVQSTITGTKTAHWLCSTTNAIYTDRNDAAAFGSFKEAHQAALAHRATWKDRQVAIVEEIGADITPAQKADLRKSLATCWLNLQNTYLCQQGTRFMTCQKEAVEDVLDSLTLLGKVSKEIEALLPKLSKDALRKLAREVVNPMALNPEIGEGGELTRGQVTWNYEQVNQWNGEQVKKRALKAKNAAIVEARENA